MEVPGPRLRRRIWPLYAALPAAGALGSWPPLRPAPAHARDLRHESGDIYMRKKLAESWDGFCGDRRSSPIWPNGASVRFLALAVFRLGSINLQVWGTWRLAFCFPGQVWGRLWSGAAALFGLERQSRLREEVNSYQVIDSCVSVTLFLFERSALRGPKMARFLRRRRR